jgi:hypothetical protein
VNDWHPFSGTLEGSVVLAWILVGIPLVIVLAFCLTTGKDEAARERQCISDGGQMMNGTPYLVGRTFVTPRHCVVVP